MLIFLHIIRQSRRGQVFKCASSYVAQVRDWAHDDNDWERLQHTPLIFSAWISCWMPRYHSTNRRKQWQSSLLNILLLPAMNSREKNWMRMILVVLRKSAFDQRFEDFVKKGLSFKNADGLNFCRVSIDPWRHRKQALHCRSTSSNMKNSVYIRDVLESAFSWCELGAHIMFECYSIDFWILSSSLEQEREVLVIHVWSSGSKIALYKDFHLCRSLKPTAGDILLKVSIDQLFMKAVEVDFKKGGL